MKRRVGLLLFWFSWALWPLTFAVPFVLDAELETVVIVTTTVLVTGEICFGLSLLLLGRPFYVMMKSRVLLLWQRWRGKLSKIRHDPD